MLKAMQKTGAILWVLVFSCLLLISCEDVIGGTDSYKIKFETGNGGSEVAEIVAAAGEEVSAPADPARPGYKFGGWLLGGEPYAFTVMPEGNITLTAKWNVLPKAPVYAELPSLSVTLREADGTPIPITDERFGPTPWNEGYPFNTTKGKVKYVPCAYDIGIADSKSTVTGVIKPKGNGSFRANPEVRRPYRIKFDQKQSVFGWPKSKQYVLISASHNENDGSRLVAHSAFELAREVLNLEYAARSQPVELTVNGVYRGVYIFAEKPRVEKGRLDIASEHAGATAPYITDTGYLLFYGNDQHTQKGEDGRAYFGVNGIGNGFLIESPDVGDIDEKDETGVKAVPEATNAGFNAQRSFIQSETQKLINAMSATNFETFKQLADIDSFVDGYILQELYGNSDVADAGYYLYKKSSAEGGKFYVGPPWDFDATVRGGYTGIKVGNGKNQLIARLYGIPEFMNLVKARWQEISPELSVYLDAKFNGYIEFSAAAFKRGAGGEAKDAYRSNNWENTAKGKRDWLLNRIDWLNGEWA